MQDDDFSLFKNELRGVKPIKHDRADTGKPKTDRAQIATLRQAATVRTNASTVDGLSDQFVIDVGPEDELMWARSRSYKVRSGDNLTLIAKANKVDVHDLQRWNKLNGQQLKVGQTLVMQDTRKLVAKAGSKKPVQYKVQKGDSLYIVAKRFNVEMQHLKRWNPRTGQALKPGQMLVVSGPR